MLDHEEKNQLVDLIPQSSSRGLMVAKREIVAYMSNATGVTRILEADHLGPRLLVLNYHRVGESTRTLFDSGIYSCTADEFDWQVAWLKKRFVFPTLEEAADIIHGRTVPKKNSVLITFDDGYRDNYQIAFPILKKHGVPGTFFLPTAFVGTGNLPWWDQIAYLIKISSKQRISLTYPDKMEFDITRRFRAQSIRSILTAFKTPRTTDPERFIRELGEACGTQTVTEAPEPCFMSWDEAREMTRGGMSFGSHTHSHEIISKLPYSRQLEELTQSKAILERELQTPIQTLAYPVGAADSFSKDSMKAAAEAGYHTAFSFYSGVNIPGKIKPFDVLRVGVSQDSRATFRFRMACLAATGREF